MIDRTISYRIFVKIAILMVLVLSDNLEAVNRQIPRFVSLRSSEVRMRAGPGFEYPITWVVHFKNMPVKVIAEYQQWRKVQLYDGTTGWMHQNLLSGNRTLLVIQESGRLLNRSDSRAIPIAKVQKNVALFFPKSKCVGSRCQVRHADYSGWIEKKAVWGLLDSEL